MEADTNLISLCELYRVLSRDAKKTLRFENRLLETISLI